MHSGQATYLLAAGPGQGYGTQYGNGAQTGVTYQTGGPINGPSADDVRRDLRNRPPPAGAKPKQASNFNNPKAKAKTLAELAAEQEKADKRAGLK